MPTPATIPLRLQVVDRIVTVLKMMDGPSADFWFKPYDATKRTMHFKECGGFPTYMVSLNASQSPEEHLDSEYVETMSISIKCFVNTELGEAQTKLLKCLRDVQKAINDDSRSTDPGSLGQLTSGAVDMGGVETDSGYLTLEGFAFFDLTITCKLVGDWGQF